MRYVWHTSAHACMRSHGTMHLLYACHVHTSTCVLCAQCVQMALCAIRMLHVHMAHTCQHTLTLCYIYCVLMLHKCICAICMIVHVLHMCSTVLVVYICRRIILCPHAVNVHMQPCISHILGISVHTAGSICFAYMFCVASHAILNAHRMFHGYTHMLPCIHLRCICVQWGISLWPQAHECVCPVNMCTCV